MRSSAGVADQSEAVERRRGRGLGSQWEGEVKGVCEELNVQRSWECRHALGVAQRRGRRGGTEVKTALGDTGITIR